MLSEAMDFKGYATLARQVAAEGAVLLRNEAAALPVKMGETVALFGRMQAHYYKSGTGSGGMVNAPYEISLLDALLETDTVRVEPSLLAAYQSWEEDHPIDRGAGWAQEPWSQAEMPLEDTVVSSAVRAADLAVVVIGRTAGEDKDFLAEKGSYFLSDLEESMLEKITAAFDRVAVVLNVGSIIDMGFVQKYQPQAVLCVWQGGQEGGNAALDVLTGRVNPSGCLPDTIAQSLCDYPSDKNFGGAKVNIYQEDIFVGYRYFESVAKEKALYPFGFGLSYTTFAVAPETFDFDGETLKISATVSNTGSVAGKKAVQLYIAPPQGKLGKPARQLIAFEKTLLLAPGQKQRLTFAVPVSRFASYDDLGQTGNASCYVLEKGLYRVHIGQSVRDTLEAGCFELDSDRVVQRLRRAMAPTQAFERFHMAQKDGQLQIGYEAVPQTPDDSAARAAQNRPESRPVTGDKGIRLNDVYEGRHSLDVFIDQIDNETLACLLRGEGMSSPKVTAGTAAAFGGITERLKHFGIPVGCCTDGPSGLRLDSGAPAFSLPSGTLLAATFNPELVGRLYAFTAQELLLNRVELLLGPGMNIHRHPLNGRNFEYFSEDPYLSGVTAAAQLKAMAGYGVSGVIKHFCANNQEYKRTETDSVVSERALREIYLKGFEIAVKEGGAFAVMTTYGALNGIWTAGHYDLLTTVLRGEWGFDGLVMTDWWAVINEQAGGAPSKLHLKAMARAQNDLYMVVADSLAQNDADDLLPALQSGALSRGELVRCAKNILKVLMRTAAMNRAEDAASITPAAADWPVAGAVRAGREARTLVDISRVKAAKGESALFKVRLEAAGQYGLGLRYQAAGDERAQINVVVFIDGVQAAALSLNGTNGQIREIERPLGFSNECERSVRLYFSADGLQIDQMWLSFQSGH